MLKIKETNVTIMVSNMQRAIDFYQKLGMTLKNNWENYYAQVAAPDIIIGLHPAKEKIEASSSLSIGFMVDDLETVQKMMDENQFAYQTREAKEGKYIYFTDPDGYNLYYMQPSMSW